MNNSFDSVIDRIGTVILGKQREIRLALSCLFAGGHLLIEDLPGIGKTTLAKALSLCLGLDFRRVQCTSDMLPGDILGVSIFDAPSGGFRFHRGPVFTQILLADEINRATPKTQSALLEVMEEKQVSIEGRTYSLEAPFFVIATQNPSDQAGTFPLPESQLDRFLMRIQLGYPNREAERLILRSDNQTDRLSNITSPLSADVVLEMQGAIRQVTVSDALLDYLQDILVFTRSSGHFVSGLSPRAGLSLLNTARSWAYLYHRDYVIPEDVQQVLPWVIGHRLRSSADGGEYPLDQLQSLLNHVPVP